MRTLSASKIKKEIDIGPLQMKLPSLSLPQYLNFEKIKNTKSNKT